MTTSVLKKALLFTTLSLTPFMHAHGDKDPVIIKFKKSGKTIHLSELKKSLKDDPQLSNAPLEMVFTPMRGKLIAETLIDMAAQNDKALNQSAEVKTRQEACLKQAKRDIFMRQHIEKKVTEGEIKKQYDVFANSYKGQEAVELKHILVSDKGAAAKIIGQLNSGASFATLAKEHSMDPASKDGKSLGLLTKNELPPTFGEVAFTLKKGEFAKTPVQSDFGWHVILLVDKKPAKAPDYKTVKEDIKAGLMQAKAQIILQELAENEGIEAFNIDGTPATQQTAQ